MPLPRPRSNAEAVPAPRAVPPHRAAASPSGPYGVPDASAAGPGTGTLGPHAPAPRGRRSLPLPLFNAAPADEARALLLGCCASRRWAARLAAHRPYPDVDALLAAADEAGYDLTTGDLDEALAGEPALHPAHPAPGEDGLAGDDPAAAYQQRGVLAAHTALRAAHAAYESRFGHAFVICLDGYRPDERLDQTLAGVRARLGNDAEDERTVAAEELRRLARGRLGRAVSVDAAAAD